MNFFIMLFERAFEMTKIAQKIEYLSRLFRTEKFHDMPTVTFLGNAAVSRLSPFKVENQEIKEVLSAHVVHSVGVSEYGHYTAQA